MRLANIFQLVYISIEKSDWVFSQAGDNSLDLEMSIGSNFSARSRPASDELLLVLMP